MCSIKYWILISNFLDFYFVSNHWFVDQKGLDFTLRISDLKPPVPSRASGLTFQKKTLRLSVKNCRWIGSSKRKTLLNGDFQWTPRRWKSASWYIIKLNWLNVMDESRSTVLVWRRFPSVLFKSVLFPTVYSVQSDSIRVSLCRDGIVR